MASARVFLALASAKPCSAMVCKEQLPARECRAAAIPSLAAKLKPKVAAGKSMKAAAAASLKQGAAPSQHAAVQKAAAAEIA